MEKTELEKAWSEACVANLMSVSDPETGEVYGGFAITEGSLQIFSLDPEEDYEVNPNTITNWRMVFSSGEDVLGYADYQATLQALEPYVLACENGSILVQKLNKTDLEQLFRLAGGQTSISLTV